MDLRSVGHEDGGVGFVHGDAVAVVLPEEWEGDVIARTDDDAMDVRNDRAVFKEDPAGDRFEDVGERCCVYRETFERTNLS